jgi:site-specific recombinase XerD
MLYDLNPFTEWLTARHYSPATIRNYLVDINRFLSFSSDTDEPFLSPTIVLQYLQSLSANNNQKRYLASLNIFCQFALDQHLIDTNPLQKIRKQIRRKTALDPQNEINNLKNSFASYLEAHHNTPTTIKNYLNDVDQYINWLNSQPSSGAS